MAKQGTSRWGRLASLGRLTGSMAKEAVASSISRMVRAERSPVRARDLLGMERVRDLAHTLRQLKGGAMKVGQQLATYAEAMDLPEDVREVLASLHDQAASRPYADIEATLLEEMQRPLQDIFAHIDPMPLGTASLAQAHAATLLDGRQVVIKVLHEGVKEAIGTDLLALRGMLMSSRLLARPKAEIDDIFAELRDRLLEETDYLQEAANLHQYATLYGGDPRVEIPAPVVALSTERVLVLDRLYGMPLSQFLRTADEVARQRAARTLCELACEQLFRHRILHADPHDGNFLFKPDGTVGLLDFGCVKRFDAFFVGSYARAALSLMDNDRAAALDACFTMGAWDGVDRDDAEALWAFLQGVGRGFRSGTTTLGTPQDSLLQELRGPTKRLISHPNVRAPRDVVMIHRTLGGLYAICRRLGARADFGAIVRPHAAWAVQNADSGPT